MKTYFAIFYVMCLNNCISGRFLERSLDFTAESYGDDFHDVERRFTNWLNFYFDDEATEMEFKRRHAEVMMRYWDSSVDPCEDFYRFSCGNWVAQHSIRPNENIYNVFQMIKDFIAMASNKLLIEFRDRNATDYDSNEAKWKAVRFYDSCMDMEQRKSDGFQPLLKVLEDFGGWPLLEDDWNPESFNWVEIVANLNQIWVNLMICGSLYIDYSGDKTQKVHLQIPLNLGIRAIDGNETHGVEIYRNYMIDVMKIFNVSEEKANIASREVLEFQQKLRNLQLSVEQNSSTPESHFAVKTVGSLRDEIPEIDWLTLISKLHGNPINESTQVIVLRIEYFKGLPAIVNETKLETIANYIGWEMVKNFIHTFDDSLVESIKQYSTVLGNIEMGGTDGIPLWRNCINYLDSYFGDVIGGMFVEKYYRSESGVDAVNLIAELKTIFQQNLIKNTWMTNSTKEKALNKLSNIGLKIGHSEDVLSTDKLNDQYKDLHVNRDHFFETLFNAIRWKFRQQQKLSGKYLGREFWGRNPHEVNAFARANTNEMVVPSGILQPPFYHSSFPKSLQYGAIGSLFGHELSHPFDSFGSFFDHNGDYSPAQWDPETAVNFRKVVQCLSEQYSNYTFDGIQIDGYASRAENLADNSGLAVSFATYKKWLADNPEDAQSEQLPGMNLTNEQTFFLAYGQMWCAYIRPKSISDILESDPDHLPEYIRVHGALKNSEDFSHAFQCELGSPMNPEQKCTVW